MASGVVTIGHKKYAVGLYWENSPNGHIAQTAREAARQSATPAEYYVTRSGNDQGRVPQFGLAPKNKGFKSGMPSLAGCLAVQQPGSWIGAFRFREGVAVIIVRDDLIVPDGDLFFADEAEARDRLFEEVAVGGFHRIFAPEPWGVPSADTMPISLILNDHTGIKLSSVSLSSQTKLIMMVAGGLLVLVAALGFYIQDQMEQEELSLRQQMASMEAARRAAQQLIPGLTKKPDYPPPERKWEKRPDPLLVIEACQHALKQVPVSLSGWSLSGLRCDESALSVSWIRKKAFALPPPKGTVEDRAHMATRVILLDPIEARGSQELVDPEFITNRYLAQNWTGSITRIADDPPPPPPSGYSGDWTPPPTPWVKRSFTLSVPVLPWTVPTFLAGIPGIIVKSMTRGGLNGGWTIEGEIYENRR